MTAQTILPANTLSGGYNVANSLRFNDGDSAYLNFTPSSNGSRRIFTISFWFKQTNSGATRALFSTGNYSGGDGYLQINLSSSGRLTVDDYDQSGDSYNLRWTTPSTFLIKDPSAWYHIVLAVDSTQGTQSNRAKVYLNGVDISSDFTQTTSTAQNDDFHVNTSSQLQQIGRSQNNNNYYDGYLAEFVMIDGSALAPTSFGEFDEDSGIWKPIDVSGLTFGTNGFYLEFKESGTSQNSSGLGADTSGNDHHYAVNNLAATDQSTDTCTNNFATLNPLHKIDDWSLQEGNLQFTQNSTGHRMTNSTIAVSQGKWYAEVKAVELGGTHPSIGVINPDDFQYNTYLGNSDRGYGYIGDGRKQFGNSASSFGNSYATNDIIGIAMDLDNHKLYFSKNGTFQNSGDPTTGSTGTGSAFDLATGVFYSFAQSSYDANTDPVFAWNFGSPAFAISSGNADANGYGNFEYSVPSGYYALNSKNLAEFG